MHRGWGPFALCINNPSRFNWNGSNLYKFIQENYFVELSQRAVFSSQGFCPCQSENFKCVFPEVIDWQVIILFCLFKSQYDKAQLDYKSFLTFHISILQSSMDLMDSIVLIICTTSSQELNRSRYSSSQYIELNDLVFYGQLHQRDYHIWICRPGKEQGIREQCWNVKRGKKHFEFFSWINIIVLS